MELVYQETLVFASRLVVTLERDVNSLFALVAVVLETALALKFVLANLHGLAPTVKFPFVALLANMAPLVLDPMLVLVPKDGLEVYVK